MTYRVDPNRPLGGPLHRPADNERSKKMMWVTFGVLAILLVAGFMFYNSGGHGPETVSSNSPAVTQTTPTSAPGSPTPAPIPKQ